MFFVLENILKYFVIFVKAKLYIKSLCNFWLETSYTYCFMIYLLFIKFYYGKHNKIKI